MPQVYPGSTCWFLIGHLLHSSLQGVFWHKYGSDPCVIVRWKNTILFPIYSLLLIIQDKYKLCSTYLFISPIPKTNPKNLLNQHILNTSQSILPRPSTSPHPCLLIHFPNLGCHYWPHLDLILVLAISRPCIICTSSTYRSQKVMYQ